MVYLILTFFFIIGKSPCACHSLKPSCDDRVDSPLIDHIKTCPVMRPNLTSTRAGAPSLGHKQPAIGKSSLILLESIVSAARLSFHLNDIIF